MCVCVECVRVEQMCGVRGVCVECVVCAFRAMLGRVSGWWLGSVSGRVCSAEPHGTRRNARRIRDASLVARGMQGPC